MWKLHSLVWSAPRGVLRTSSVSSLRYAGPEGVSQRENFTFHNVQLVIYRPVEGNCNLGSMWLQDTGTDAYVEARQGEGWPNDERWMCCKLRLLSFLPSSSLINLIKFIGAVSSPFTNTIRSPMQQLGQWVCGRGHTAAAGRKAWTFHGGSLGVSTETANPSRQNECLFPPPSPPFSFLFSYLQFLFCDCEGPVFGNYDIKYLSK